MSAINSRTHTDTLVNGQQATHDLIVLNGDRIVFHDHYDSPQQRLDRCISLLTIEDTFKDVIDAVQVLDTHHSLQRRRVEPDQILNAIAKLCRRWGLNIYLSTTHKKTGPSPAAAPLILYSMITNYGPDSTIAEHFSSRQARHEALIERAETFTRATLIPYDVLNDETRLAELVATILMPATITLTESALDKENNFYRPIADSTDH
ncbi:hypothetical protein [Arthrobacter castelli]|uniref:hypothetical protein n=1 Tax=Arthrobacter castelli TaxID=271431 RepID=UPI00042691F7|nr:hypothetical protein [Arthrobacter castelli]